MEKENKTKFMYLNQAEGDLITLKRYAINRLGVSLHLIHVSSLYKKTEMLEL